MTTKQQSSGYQQAQASLAARTERAVLIAYRTLDASRFVATSAATVAKANVLAVALADLSLAALLGVLTLGLGRPDDDTERLEGSFTTLVRIVSSEVSFLDLGRPLAEQVPTERSEPVLDRVGRIGHTEPAHSGRRAFTEAMQAHSDLVIGWRRKTAANPCPLCASLANEEVLDPSVSIVDHPRCMCIAVPVLIEEEAA